jgi:hypothetical protein
LNFESDRTDEQVNFDFQKDHPSSQAQQGLQPLKNEGDPSDPSKKSKFLKNLQQLNFEVGGIYWCEKFAKKVKIIKLLKTLPEAEVYIAREVGTHRVSLSELAPAIQEFTPGVQVEILSAKNKGDRFIVSSLDGSDIWLKKTTKGFAAPVGPFNSSQLRRVEE